MSTVSGATSQSINLAALRAEEGQGSTAETENLAPVKLASDTHRVDVDTTVTTLVFSTSDAELPDLRLKDVLDSSGVEEGAQITLLIDDASGSQDPSKSEGIGDGQVDSPDEQLQDAIDAIESSGAVVVEVETTNNVQTVTVKAADIDTVYTQAHTLSDAVPSSNSANYLLLKNGWVYTDMQSSPLDLRLEPEGLVPGDGWALWRSGEDGGHEIQDVVTGIWNTVVGQVVDTSPKSAADVAGVFKSNSVESQTMFTSSSVTTLQLSPEGVFTNTRTSLTTSASLFQEASYVLQTLSSAVGSSSSFSGTAQSGGIQTAALGSSENLTRIAGDMFGSYRILEDGMTLELQFADGTTHRQLFLRTEKSGATIDGKDYYRAKDVSPDFLQDLMDMLAASGATDSEGKWLKALSEAMQKGAVIAPTEIVEQPVDRVSGSVEGLGT